MATNLNETIYTINQIDEFGTIMGEETLNITNCYLVFRKFELEKKDNLLVPFNNIPERNDFGFYWEYLNVATKSIIDQIADLYENVSFTSCHIIRERYDGISIEEIIYDEFKFLFLKSKDNLILLNYINIYRCKDFFSYFPLEVKNNNTFTHSFIDNRFSNNDFLVVNTFEPFLKYAKEFGQIPNKCLNGPFFQCFENYFRNGEIYGKGSYYYCILKGNNKVFKFYSFKNNIIILYYDVLQQPS